MTRLLTDPWPVAAQTSWRRVLTTAVLVQATMGVPLLICAWQCVPAMEWLMMGSILTLMVAVCALLGGLLVTPFRPGYGLRAAAWGGAGVLSGIVLTAAAGHARMVSLLVATERARPLLVAIALYERDRGAPPPDLQALIPAYLPAVPVTGLPAYPEFLYERAPSGAGPAAPPWQLRLPCSLLMDFDELVYWPGEDYPPRLHGVGVTRSGGWAYVND